MGPQLGSNLLNLGIEEATRTALEVIGVDMDEVLACEEEPGLGRSIAEYCDEIWNVRPVTVKVER